MDFLCAYEENNFSSPQLHVDKLPIENSNLCKEEHIDEVNIILPQDQSSSEKITIPSITGVDMVYEKNADGIWNTTSIDVVTPYEVIENGRGDKAYLPYREEDRKACKDAFDKSNLLRNGISCKIDKVEILSFENHSQVTCTITIQNNDNIDYYILDPKKMGDLDFNYFTGGLTLQNMDTKLTHPLRWPVQSGTWSNITMDDLSLLEKGSKTTYTFKSSDYYKMELGKYSARFRFCGTEHCTPNFNLNQNNGRVWVGQMMSNTENIEVD